MDKYTGLNDIQVAESRRKYGRNELTMKNRNSFFKLFCESLGDPIIKILLIALGVKVIFLINNFDWYETIGIVIAIFIASLISSLSEYGSEKAFFRLQEEASRLYCRVKRNSKILLVPFSDVVVDDIILLESGDKIPADGVIVYGDIMVDESSINGESCEVLKTAVIGGNETDENRVFMGCVVYSNQALMRVSKIGDKTFYGSISSELQQETPSSPLKIRLQSLAKTISKFGYISAFLVSLSYLFSVIVINNGFDINLIKETVCNFDLMASHLLYALTLAVTIIVVAVPEGLPMMITMVLSSNMKRMIKDNVMVRKLVGIETAGCINVLFTDKTGTLTKGNFIVEGFMGASLKEYKTFDEIEKGSKFYDLIGLSCIANNSSKFDNGKIIGGNITDKAICEFVKSYESIKYNVLKFTSFNSSNKYSSVTLDIFSNITFVKGAPEVIIPLCDKMYNEDGNVRTLYLKKNINDLIESKTKDGIRVLALAATHGDMKKLNFIGLIFLVDEIRNNAKEAVDIVRNAHINTIMVTGDNRNTAVSVARSVGLLRDNDMVLTSSELNNMSDEMIKRNINNIRVVARALPFDKSRLVRIAQELNLVVGMTGDGVNDAIALKKADVGFAMGSGCEVAREASDIVILDDNFMSISRAILFGRTIFKSIRRFIIFQLTVNICAVGLSILGPFIGVDTPVTVIQMLWINMVMDTLAGIAFSFECPLNEYMKEFPKRKDESILNKYMLNEIIITGAYSCLLCVVFLKSSYISSIFRDGDNSQYLMSAFFGLFIFISIFNSFNARTSRINIFTNIFGNKVFLAVIGFITIIQILLIYFGGNLFRTVGLNFREFNLMLLLAITVIPVDLFRKFILKIKGCNMEV